MDSRARSVIATLCVPAFMMGTDFTGALMLVVPIEHEYSADITTTQWVLNVYALTFAMALVAGGRLGDMFGRRRLLLAGLGIFLVASLACAMAPSITWLIGARAVQGIGAAIAWPCVLAMAATSVEEEERGAVLALVIGSVSVGNVVAPFLAGIIGGLGEWRLFFYANVTLAAVSALLVLRFLDKEAAERTDERIDALGMAVLSLAVLALLYGLDIGADWGWTSLPLAALFAASLVLFVAFPLVEKRVRDPMVPPPMMRNGQFMLALSTNGLVSPAMFLMFLYMPQYLHKIMGWPVLWASIGTLPLLLTLCALNLTAGRFYNRIGPRKLLSAGHILTVAAAVWIALMPASWGYAGVAVPMALLGTGCGMIFGPAGTAAINAADPKRAGMAGGLSFMFHLALGAIGVAGGTALMFGAGLASLRRGLEGIGVKLSAADQTALASGAIHSPEVQQILGRFGPEETDKVIAVVREAFVAGMHRAFWLAFAFALLGLIFSLCLNEKRLRGVDREDTPA